MSLETEKLRKKAADGLLKVFKIGVELGKAGDSYANHIKQIVLSLAESFPEGRVTGADMRKLIDGSVRVVSHGGGPTVRKRAPAKPYMPKNKHAVELDQDPARDVESKTVPPEYTGDEVDPTPPAVDDNGDGEGTEAAGEAAQDEGADGATITDINLALPEGYSVHELAKADAGALAGSFTEKDLKGILKTLGGKAGNSRTKAALAKRVVATAKALVG